MKLGGQRDPLEPDAVVGEQRGQVVAQRREERPCAVVERAGENIEPRGQGNRPVLVQRRPRGGRQPFQ